MRGVEERLFLTGSMQCNRAQTAPLYCASSLVSLAPFRSWRVHSASADARDLASGFFLLCSGNKSVKLASAFRLLDEDGDDQLTREGVWRFLR